MVMRFITLNDDVFRLGSWHWPSMVGHLVSFCPFISVFSPWHDRVVPIVSIFLLPVEARYLLGLYVKETLNYVLRSVPL